MNTVVKVIIPNKSWILEDSGVKLGTLNKEKKGFSFFRKGTKLQLKTLSEVKFQFGSDIFNDIPNIVVNKHKKEDIPLFVYEYPCNSRPYNPIYNVKKKLPIYSKSSKSKSLYCAGHYVIKFRKGWVKSFCPKLITLERYPYYGPFKTEEELKSTLAGLHK